MVTAYSPILKLALPVQGELSGTWGDVVNDNITSMVEQAIAGRAVIDTWTTNSHVLTTANGTTSESRCAMLEFTDTGTALSGAGTVTCPTLSKIYIAKNASGQNVTLKTSGGTGILVPNGRTMFLFCDGTNVVEAVTSTTSLQLGISTIVTAVLDEDDMASDSATSLATQQSIKAYVDSQVGTVDTLAEILAIGNTTGATDIAVDSAQKVQFRDAAIYINSSVDGQLDIVADTEIQIAATTVDLNGALDVSGTALVTGVLTTTAATVSNGGGQFNGAINVGIDDTGYDVKFFGATTGKYLLWDESADSLIVTGTTTLVGTTNLDAVDIDGATQIDATVTVGVDDTGYDVKFFGATAGAYMLWDESADTLEVSGTVTADGLTVDGASTLNNISAGTTVATLSGQYTGSGSVKLLEFQRSGGAVGGAITYKDAITTMEIGTITSHPLNLSTADTQRLTIAANGDISFYEDLGVTAKFFWDASAESLGIGTTPSAWNSLMNATQIGTAASFWGSTNTSVAAMTANAYYNSDGNYIYINTDEASQYIQVDGTHSWLNAPSGSAGTTATLTERMRIDASGNVGIGVVPDAWSGTGAAIQLEGAGHLATANQYAYIGSNYYYNGGWKYTTSSTAAQYRQDSGTHQWLTAASGSADAAITWSESMRIDSSGNVGIGTASPASDTANERILQVNAPTTYSTLSLSTSRESTSGETIGKLSFDVLNNTATYRSRAQITTQSAGSTANKYGADMIFFTASDNTTDAEERMRIDSSGNVGIGSSTANHFSIAGTANVLGVKSSSGALVSIAATGTNFSGIDLGTDSLRRAGMYSLNGSVLGFYTNPTNSGTGLAERMSIDSSGNVNVGVPTADASSNYISVTGGLAGSQLNAQMRFYGKSVSNTGDTYETGRISGGSTSAAYALSGGLVFSTSSNNGSNVLTLAERMRITDTGNVGIGNSLPLGRLTISNAAGTNAPSTVTAANTYLQLGSDDYGPSNNGKFMIGFGFTDATNTNSPAYIGYEEATTSGDTYGDLTFYTRSVVTDTAPTERMRIDSTGAVTMPYQPAFSVNNAPTTQANIAINTVVTITWAGERFDQNADFDLGANSFTAPVTGKYQFNLVIRLQDVDIDADYYIISIVTSNVEYKYIFDPVFASDPAYFTVNLSVLADLDASDTAYTTIYQGGGAAQTDITGDATYTYFTGYLVA
jgi:hypothetical protein